MSVNTFGYAGDVQHFQPQPQLESQTLFTQPDNSGLLDRLAQDQKAAAQQLREADVEALPKLDTDRVRLVEAYTAMVHKVRLQAIANPSDVDDQQTNYAQAA